MAEPNNTTEETAEARPAATANANVSDDASAASSTSEARLPSAPDARADVRIDPEAVVETSARDALEGEPVRSEGALSLAEVAAKASEEIEARILARSRGARARPAPRESAPAGDATASPGDDARPLAAYELLARSARLADLVALTDRVVTDAAQTRVTAWAFTAKVAAAAEEAKLTRDDADSRFGNALDVLATGGEGRAERALASALWAHAVAESPRSRAEDEDRLAGDILWLATHTAFDATPLLDRALGDEAEDLWVAIADRVRRIERGRGGALGRGEAVVGCAALAASISDKARALAADLAGEVKDPVLLRVLATAERAAREETRLEGELLPAPRGPVATLLLALSGLLLVLHAARLAAKIALAYKRPAEVIFSEAGVRVKTRTQVLGRTLREREHVLLEAGLARVVREVRFPRAGFYAGLLALALGSYVGVRAFADGVRSASPSLLAVGLLIVALGVGADFLLGAVLPGVRGRCRVLFVPRTGAVVCVGGVDARRADDALKRLSAR